MSKYIDVEKLKAEIDNLESFSCISEEQDGFYSAISRINDIIDILQQEQESIAERFARVFRGNLIGIDEEVQQKFEQLYFEVTGNKMCGGYND